MWSDIKTMSGKCIETIEIDDNPSSQGNTNTSIIIVEDFETDIAYNKAEFNDRNNPGIQEKKYKYHNLLVKVISICLELENSVGMSRIIYKVLLRQVANADPEYEKSEEFKKILEKTVCSLETDPDHKFSHLKNLCDNLKLHKYKKRVELITLSREVDKSKDNFNGSRLTNYSRKRNHSPSNTKPKRQKLDIIDISDDDIVLVDAGARNIDLNSSIKNHSDKENNHSNNIENVEIILENNINNNDTTHEKCIDKSEHIPNQEDNHHLVPVVESNFESPLSKDKKIKEIEEKIALHKARIQFLDKQEVSNDSMDSPYLQCEQHKACIVDLYRKLCELTGEDTVKRCEMRLTALPGHPSGPVRYLQDFLNKNIGENGEPPFPDFDDVVTCVVQANHNESLGWTKYQIMNEAKALFTQCGRALQKRRQQREWRDLLNLIDTKDIKDPADDDPELKARLEQNKLIAKKKEEEIMERYANMEKKSKPTEIQIEISAADDTNCRDSNGEVTCAGSQLVVNESITDEANYVPENIETNAIVKQEPIDISSILDSLGNDYTTTIYDIEDPFMVIEISSESEDDNCINSK